MSKSRREIEEEDLPEIDIEDDDDDDDEDEDDDDDEVSLADIMQTFFAGENNKNVVDTLATFHETMKTQNKILMKIANTLESIQKTKDLS
tara:strand:- start:2104 stop:2373 length:270 start_codon:yes stop_codon:yes gene_type:complete